MKIDKTISALAVVNFFNYDKFCVLFFPAECIIQLFKREMKELVLMTTHKCNHTN